MAEETPAEHTKRLAVTHTPLGTHGLWGSKDEHLPDYIENIAAAMIRKGYDESKAIAIAIADAEKLADPDDPRHIRPEVQGAAQGAVAELKHLQAEHERARDAERAAEKRRNENRPR